MIYAFAFVILVLLIVCVLRIRTYNADNTNAPKRWTDADCWRGEHSGPYVTPTPDAAQRTLDTINELNEQYLDEYSPGWRVEANAGTMEKCKGFLDQLTGLLVMNKGDCPTAITVRDWLIAEYSKMTFSEALELSRRYRNVDQSSPARMQRVEAMLNQLIRLIAIGQGDSLAADHIRDDITEDWKLCTDQEVHYLNRLAIKANLSLPPQA